MTNPRLPVHAATGTDLTAKSWQTEAPLRMLMNNLDPEVAERPEDLVAWALKREGRYWRATAAAAEPPLQVDGAVLERAVSAVAAARRVRRPRLGRIRAKARMGKTK